MGYKLPRPAPVFSPAPTSPPAFDAFGSLSPAPQPATVTSPPPQTLSPPPPPTPQAVTVRQRLVAPSSAIEPEPVVELPTTPIGRPTEQEAPVTSASDAPDQQSAIVTESQETTAESSESTLSSESSSGLHPGLIALTTLSCSSCRCCFSCLEIQKNSGRAIIMWKPRGASSSNKRLPDKLRKVVSDPDADWLSIAVCQNE
jgi:hypothetical protein